MRFFLTFFMMSMVVVSAMSCKKDFVEPDVENPQVPSSFKVGDLYDDGSHKGVVFEVTEVLSLNL